MDVSRGVRAEEAKPPRLLKYPGTRWEILVSQIGAGLMKVKQWFLLPHCQL